MKANTHYIFSTGAGLYLLFLLGRFSFESALLVVWLSFAVNFVIDMLGHSIGKSGHTSRTMFTHSIFTAPLWGAVVWFISVYLVSVTSLSRFTDSSFELWTIAGVLIALGHLFLDSLTQAGVYYWRHRVAIAHFSYDNFLLNAGFIAVGVLLGVSALLQIRLL